MDNRLCTFLHLGTEAGRQSLPCQDPSPARGKMPPFKGGERSLPSKRLHPVFNCNSGHVCLVIPPLPPHEQELGEKTLSDFDSNEDADYEPSETEDSDYELEFNSDASDSEVEDVEEVELVEEDAKI